MKHVHEEKILKFIDHLGKQVTIGTFWIDGDYHVDMDNLPSKQEMATLLRAILFDRKIELEDGRFFTDEE